VPTSLLWFRRDLRLSDHPALLAAIDAAAPDGAVLPVFVLDPGSGHPRGGPRRRFLLDCLAELQTSVGGALVLRHGDPVDVPPASSARSARRACTSRPTPALRAAARRRGSSGRSTTSHSCAPVPRTP
jgi:deoxyribodipyrimidine photolyase